MASTSVWPRDTANSTTMIPDNPLSQSLTPIPEVQKGHFAGFVSKALRWVFLQLATTCLVAGAMYEHSAAVSQYLDDHPAVFWAPVFSLFLSLFGMYSTRRHEIRILWFTAFTLGMSGLVGVSILPYSPKAILLTTSATMVIVGCTALYSARVAARGENLQAMGPALGTGLTSIIILGIANVFLKLPWLHIGIAVVSVLLFTGYLAYDLTRLYNREDVLDLCYEDGLIIATELYLDIINIFLELLELVGSCSDGN